MTFEEEGCSSLGIMGHLYVGKKDHAQSLCAKPHSTGSPKVCEQRWNKHFSCWWQTRNQLLRSNPAEKHANDRTSLQPATVVKGGPVIDPSSHSTLNVQDGVRKMNLFRGGTSSEDLRSLSLRTCIAIYRSRTER